MNAFTLYVAGFFLSLSLLALPSFCSDLAVGEEIISAGNQPAVPRGWSYKKIALGTAACTLCVISATISPTLGLCTTASVLGGFYYWLRKSSGTGEVLCCVPEDPTALAPDCPEVIIIPSSSENGPPLPGLRSFEDLKKPLKDLQITILGGSIEGLSDLTIESLAQSLSEKRTLNAIAVDYERITQNIKLLCAQLIKTNTEDSVGLKTELEKFFRHFKGDDIINKRIVIFLLLTNNTISATEQDYFLNFQDDQALASYFSRLVIKFKELETGRGVEGIGILSLKTLKTEYQLLSGYARHLLERDGRSDDELVKLAELSFQITHIDREDRLKKIFQNAKTLDDAYQGILDALTQQRNKELTWHTSESSAAKGISLKVFNLEGFYKVSLFKGIPDASGEFLTAQGVKYEKQPHQNSYKEKEGYFYLKIWKDNNFLSEHVLDKSIKNILQAVDNGGYKIIAVAFGKDKSPNSTKRAFYLIPTKLNLPRLVKHEGMIERIIYRLHSPYKNTEENLTALNELLLAYWQNTANPAD